MTRVSDKQIAEGTRDLLDMLREAQQRMEDYAAAARGGPTRGRLMTHALLQGAYAAKVDAAKFRDNPYETYDYRWAWMTGFDLGRRIDRAHKIIRMCGEAMDQEITAADELQSLRQELAAMRDRWREEMTTLSSLIDDDETTSEMADELSCELAVLREHLAELTAILAQENQS